MDVIHS